MKKQMLLLTAILCVPFFLCGFTSTSQKTTNPSMLYCVTAVLAVVVFLVYLFGIKKKNAWFIVLFISVFVVNIGYFSLAVSDSLSQALTANRIAYLGSVFLPMSLLMIILDISKTKYKKWLPGILIAVCICVFLVAASPGYLDIYYKDVSLVTVNGISVLQKVYGPLHILYLFYILIYFCAMIALTVTKTIKKQIGNSVHATVVLASVFVNIIVWLLEQFININFELLSVSYVLTEMLLVGVCFLIQESEKQKVEITSAPNASEHGMPIECEQNNCECSENKSFAHELPAFAETEEYKNFMFGLGTLTHTENIIYNYYIEGKSTKEILVLLDITENTLKYHNKNIYSKLGVSSRKQLREIALRIAGKTINND